MKNILFLTDYAEHTKYTYQYALRIGQHFNAIIHFGHIFPLPSPSILEDDFGADVAVDSEIDKHLEAQFDIETEKLKEFAKAQTPKPSHYLIGDFFIRAGNTTEEILDIANGEKIDLIVMGMRQKSKLANTLFGNIALKIIDKAPCPVFLVPKRAMYMGLNNIVYASDYESPDLLSLQLLLEWAKAFETTLHVIHVVTKTTHIKSTPYIDALIKAFPIELEEGLLEFQFVEGDIKKEIIQHVKDMNGDMVALTKGNRKYWNYLLDNSITNGILGEVDIPVLVFKRKVKIL